MQIPEIVGAGLIVIGAGLGIGKIGGSANEEHHHEEAHH